VTIVATDDRQDGGEAEAGAAVLGGVKRLEDPDPVYENSVVSASRTSIGMMRFTGSPP
jgi:hypothetical protein